MNICMTCLIASYINIYMHSVKEIDIAFISKFSYVPKDKSERQKRKGRRRLLTNN